MATSGVTAFRQWRPRRGRRSRRSRPLQPYRLGEFIGAYVLSLSVVSATFALAGPLGIVAYFVCGFALTRFISRRVIWWRQANSIENVYLAKVATFLRWPVAIAAFIWKLAVVKAL
jgi:hypothetical protein